MKISNFLYLLLFGNTLIFMFSVFTFLPLRFASWNPGIDSEWVGFAEAVIGDIIDGGMTLLGVRDTIFDKEKDEFFNNYFKFDIILDEVHIQLIDIHHNSMLLSLSNMGKAHDNLRCNRQVEINSF
ncbi:hypothetical protein ACIQAA_09050 [Neobacillus sp. NPDC093182]|uniref:hypothetical protein n=1 Tax=Neobacillus sp. NPDC093182 TaxID=3364297 RepID=UPI0038226844